MRQMRSTMLDVARRRLRAHRPRQRPERALGRRQARVRNSLITVTTVIGLQLGALISGAVITEQIFGIAGLRPADRRLDRAARLRVAPGRRPRGRGRLRGRQPRSSTCRTRHQPAHPRSRNQEISYVEARRRSPRARRRRIAAAFLRRRPRSVAGGRRHVRARGGLRAWVAPHSPDATDFNAILASPAASICSAPTSSAATRSPG